MHTTAHNLTETFDATPDSVAAARAHLAGFAASAGASTDQVDSMRLATSEAMTNCVMHAYGPEPGAIRLNATVVSGELWIVISDDGHGLAPRADGRGLGMGLGLGLISQVSDDFAIVSRASGGTEVRIGFTLRGDGSGTTGSVPRTEGRRAVERRGGFAPSMMAAV